MRRKSIIVLATLSAFAIGGCKREHAKVAKTTVQVTTASAGNIALQSEIVRADQTIAPVAKKLDLMNQWMISEDDAIAKLKKATKVDGVKGTSLLEISVLDADGKLAADIANGLAESYRDRMAEQAASQKAKSQSIKGLEEQIEVMRKNAADDPASAEALRELVAELAEQKAEGTAPSPSVIIHERAQAR